MMNGENICITNRVPKRKYDDIKVSSHPISTKPSIMLPTRTMIAVSMHAFLIRSNENTMLLTFELRGAVRRPA